MNHAHPAKKSDLYDGTATGEFLHGYEAFKTAPLGTVVVQRGGHFNGKMHVKTSGAFWSSFFGDWAGIADWIGKVGGGVSPNPGGRHEIVTPPADVTVPLVADIDPMPAVSTRLSVNMNTETATALREIAEGHGVSVTEAVRRVVSVAYFIESEVKAGNAVQVVDSKSGRVREVVLG